MRWRLNGLGLICAADACKGRVASRAGFQVVADAAHFALVERAMLETMQVVDVYAVAQEMPTSTTSAYTILQLREGPKPPAIFISDSPVARIPDPRTSPLTGYPLRERRRNSSKSVPVLGPGAPGRVRSSILATPSTS